MIKRAAALCCSVFLMTVSLHAAAPSPNAVNWDALDATVAVPGELLVGFKTPPAGQGNLAMAAQARLAVHAAVGATVKRQYSLIVCDHVTVPQGLSLKDAAARYAADPNVAYVEPNYIVHALVTPNDPRFSELWGMTRIHAPEAWDKTTGSTNVLVAVIDTGIDRDHPDLLTNMWVNPGETGLDGGGHNKMTNGVDDDLNGYPDDWRGWDFVNNDNNPMDDHGHGTHCAGTIGAVGNNAVGVVGVNWSVKMVGLKFLSAGGSGTTAAAIEAVQYAASKIPGVRLTSNSWGGGGFSQALKDAIDAAAVKGQLFIASAGNNTSNNDSTPSYPASYTSANIVAVASITEAGGLSGFSNYGATSVDIGAPGSLILSTQPGNRYQVMSGTSMAAPHVAGAAALLWSQNPALPWSDVRSALLDSARPNAGLAGRVVTGGELDVNAALDSLNPPVLEASLFSVIEGQTTNVNVRLFKQPVADMTVTVERVSGSTNLYAVAAPPLVFTPANWSNAQSFTVGSWIDLADRINDEAVFQVTAQGGGKRLFTLRQLDLGDLEPPQCSFSGAVSADGATLIISMHFDESVVGFDDSDLVYSSNIGGGATFLDRTDVTGSNRDYRVRFAIGGRLGSLTLTIPAGRLTDLSGNANPNPEYRFVYTLPWVKNDFADDFEHGSTWTRSTNVYAELTGDGWRFGPPVFGGSWTGPVAAVSATNCWGTMAGPYSLPLDGWVQSPTIPVGGNPVLSFQLWLGSGGYGYVEAQGAAGWKNVTPGIGVFSSTGGGWVRQQVGLDDAQFGNRTIRVRFRAVDSAMYVDDVRVDSERAPAVWLVTNSPSHGPAGTTVPVSFTVYNSTTATLSNVQGAVSSPDSTAAIVAGSPVSYGTLAPGVVAVGAAPVSLQLAAAVNFDAPDIQLVHSFTDAGALASSDSRTFTVDGVSNPAATNSLVVKSSAGVTNWLGRYLGGNGGDTSCLFQVLYAGTNGVPAAPGAHGGAGGDDRLLYSSDRRLPWGRFGEGDGIPSDLGQFVKTFAHNYGSGAKVYVRAWDASAFDSSAAYGDSGLYTLGTAVTQTRDFGAWNVGRPAPGSFRRDSNGDGVPDGWCVVLGLDPHQPALPLGASVVAARAQSDFKKPNRIAVSDKFVFVADTEYNRVQVWDRALTNRFFVLGGGLYATDFSKPRGLGVNATGDRLAVADTSYNRVRVFSVNTTNGSLTALFDFGSLGTGIGQFRNPMEVAYAADGHIWVADSQQSGTCNHRIQVFDGAGGYVDQFGSQGSADGQFNRALGVGIGPGGAVYVADGDNDRIQAFAGTSFAWAFGATGAAAGQFDRVWDVHEGLAARLYVTDFYNNRIQVLNASAAPTVTVAGVYTNAGEILGPFSLPQCAVPGPDGQGLYVADTANNRVLRLTVTLDADGDGMDDVWEATHGLDPNNPADATEDPDGDGVSNLGEFRAGTDPHLRDTNGNGGSDGWDMGLGLDPLATNAPVNPPTVLSMAAAPVLARPGDVVRVTVAFSEAISNIPLMALSGAVTAGPVAMNGGGSSWYSDFSMPSGATGLVNGVESGAIGISGYYVDPLTFTSNGLFSLSDLELEISVFTLPAPSLGWQAWSGDIYRVQSTTNLILTNWVDGASVTCGTNGLMTVPNAFPTAQPVQFMRVLRLPP